MMTSDPQAWAADLTGLHAQVWARLLHGVANRQAPARHPTLATLSPDGWPEARTVVLRAADPVAGTLDLHTDLYSAKVAALRHCARAALHIPVYQYIYVVRSLSIIREERHVERIMTDYSNTAVVTVIQISHVSFYCCRLVEVVVAQSSQP